MKNIEDFDFYQRKSIEDMYKVSIDALAAEMYRKTRILWEQMNVDNAKTETLIKARDMIQKGLDKRLSQ